MRAETAARLLELNCQFYQTFAAPFAATRLRLQPGVKRILEAVNLDASLLDLGCGSGELARALARRAQRGPYAGLDFSPRLLDAVGELPAHFSLVQADLTAPGWEVLLPGRAWNWVTAFACLHHLPGSWARRALLQRIHALLAPGGCLAHSEWQFLESEKLRMRIQPWESIGLSTEEVEPGDYLLDWREGGRGLRYVHAFSEAELGELATASRYRVRESFHADGANGRLGLYQIWEEG